MKFILISSIFLFLTFNSNVLAQNLQKEYNSYKGLVMVGYQGWFNTPSDGAGRGWYHYNGKNGFKPGSCSIDFWPDVSEYKKVYKTDFNFSNGSSAYTFSSYDYSTVDTHFRWMKEYGIDGAFMQRFVAEIKNNSGLHHFNKVLSSAVMAAKKYNRAICIMYDLSGMKSGDENVLLKDIKKLSKHFSLKNHSANPSYLYHNGKPLVAVWGVGFNDKRDYGFKEAEKIIDILKEDGYSVMLGVPTNWRILSGDTQSDKKLHELIKKCDIIMPWFVGRYNETTYDNFKETIREDIKWAKSNNIDYVPLAYPGFSWINMKGNEGQQIPRNKGRFFWKQLYGAISLGAEMLYVAMFDEIDEGTAIFKCAKNVPIGKSKFVPIDNEVSNDYYLMLTGQAGRMLRKEVVYNKKMPIK